MANKPLLLSRAQILGFRQRGSSLDRRLPFAAESLRRAAWAGLQDSMPRAALLSIHARVEETPPGAWRHASLVQVWGPRYSAFVVSAADLAIFTLGRLPHDERIRRRAQQTAEKLSAFLKGRRMAFGEAGRAMGAVPNSLRYATLTGTVQLHWDGARQPLIWSVPAPQVDPQHARLELARRYLQTFGPTTADSFAHWAGVPLKDARSTLSALAAELTPVRTPLGEAWILARDEAEIRAPKSRCEGARLLPSGDTYYLLWGADRAMLVPEAKRRATLWTSRVWPGALLLGGELAGTWRRTGRAVTIDAWRRYTAPERKAIDAEVDCLPLP